MSKRGVFTIGHSTHPIDEFLALLTARGIELLVDVRTVPGSRHNPQFGSEALALALATAGIRYEWAKDLGGLRHTTAASINGAWRNASFRGYADYMQSPEFATAIERLETQAQEYTTAIMCAEAVPWRCHRSLIADALLVRGCAVNDIMSATSTTPHRLTPFAVVEGTRIHYPAEATPDGAEPTTS